MNPPKYIFQGNPKHRPKQCHPDSPTELEPYIADSELIEAVNLAIFMKRPLLIEGESGCGKTRLAVAVAYELGLPFYRWDIRSTTKVQEGLYEYDAILRLHDVQTQNLTPSINPKTGQPRNPQEPNDYCELGPLGKAFQSHDYPAVLLIDEIDKADVDFPNDLLSILDKPWKFFIRETGEIIEANQEQLPIIIITSNKEKGSLPSPFLRRCLYHYVRFPSQPEELEKIVKVHYQQKQKPETMAMPKSDLVTTAIAKFLKIREDKSLFKPPGTSEFLDWLAALHHFKSKPYAVTKLQQDKTIPYRDLVFKLRQDWQNPNYAGS
ncbi:MoxR family ATPase [Moorena sp. SIO4G3]|uniref:AAA family ATPase n=1 Tax=Moorena sp. SIO4G3 TaxID=2607821 RepID=UPI00142BA0D6|nr:MoxR family ATPase [Moorena sp. SIO4G3]NEO77607.1 MoxR family ATPase [Moorena sp. SIO4G3]